MRLLLLLIIVLLTSLLIVHAKKKNKKLAAWERCDEDQYVSEIKVKYDKYDRRLDIACTNFTDCSTYENCTLSKTCRESRLWDDDDDAENNLFVAGIAPGRRPDSLKLYCCPMYVNRIMNCTKYRLTLYKRLRFGIDYFRGLNSTNHTIRDITITKKGNQKIRDSVVYKVEAEICSYENDSDSWCPGMGGGAGEGKGSGDSGKGDGRQSKLDEGNGKQNNPESARKPNPRTEKNMNRQQYEQDFAQRKTAAALGGTGGTGNMIPQSQWIQLNPGDVLGPLGALTPAPLAIGLACLGCQQFSFENGYVTYEPDAKMVPVDGTATLACNDGWTLIGNSDVKCSEPFTWDPISSFCDKTCEKFDEVANGDIKYTDEHENRVLTKGTAELQCHNNFLATAPENGPIVCTRQYCTLGEWSDTFPTCELACLNTIDTSNLNGKIEYLHTTTDKSGTEVTPQGGKATLTCDEGYLPNPLDADEATCQSDGSFDVSFACVQACKVFLADEPEYGSVVYSKQVGDLVPLSEIATVTCDDGYQFANEETTVTIKCDDVNEFKLADICAPVEGGCADYEIVLENVQSEFTYSSTQLTENNLHPDGTIVTATCSTGSVVFFGDEWTTSTTAECFTPKWCATLISCKSACQHHGESTPPMSNIEYPEEITDSSGQKVTPPGGTAKLVCEEGSLPDPISLDTITCVDGKWDGTFKCSKACNTIINHQGSQSIIYNNLDATGLVPAGENVTVTCNCGFEFDDADGGGQREATCSDAAPEFSPTIPNCVAVCDTYDTDQQLPENLNEDSLVYNEDMLTDSGKYETEADVAATCASGHLMYHEGVWKSSATATCQSSGWSETLPDCIKACSNDLTTNSVSMNPIVYDPSINSLTPSNGTAKLTCKDGYFPKPITLDKITCGVDGQWSDKFECVKACNTILDHVGSQSIIYNYTDGSGHVPSGENVTVTCQVGYEFPDNGETQRDATCNGPDYSVSIPNCVQVCDPYHTSDGSTPSYGTAVKTESDKYLKDTQVTVTCGENSMMYHDGGWTTSAEATCDSTGWSEILPDCISVCDLLTTPEGANYAVAHYHEVESLVAEGGVAILTCKPGYEFPDGSLQMTYSCNSGSFGTETENCVKVCAAYTPKPKNTDDLVYDPLAPLSTGNFPAASTVTATCLSNYYMEIDGNQETVDTSACVSTGWDKTLPDCVAGCAKPTITNGVITYTDDDGDYVKPQGTAALVCDAPDYVLDDRSGSATATCQDGVWVFPTDPQSWAACVEACVPYDPRPDNTKLELEYNPATELSAGGYAATTTVTATCVDTFYMQIDGNWIMEGTSTCVSSGWDKTIPHCVKGCTTPPPTEIESYFTYTDDDGEYVKPQGTATLDCGDDSVLDDRSGSSTATCQGGAWVLPGGDEDEWAKCVKVCSKLTLESSTSVATYENDDEYDEDGSKVYQGAIATVICLGGTDTVTDDGTTNTRIIGQDPLTTEFTCMADGTWSTFEPKKCTSSTRCDPVIVEPLTTNTDITYTAPADNVGAIHQVGTVTEIKCGDTIVGKLKCGEDGTWQDEACESDDGCYLQTSGGYYKFVGTESTDFYSAQETCESYCGRLAILSSLDYSEVVALIQDRDNRDNSREVWYVGAKRRSGSGTGENAILTWDDGTKMNYNATQWKDGLDPDCDTCTSCECETCISMAKKQNYKYDDVKCSRGGGAVCQLTTV